MSAPDPDVVDPRVERWIAGATQGLAEAPAQRVREEILDHIAEAMDAGEIDGLDGSAALERALRDLGDADRAGRALRRANLRPWEAKIIGGLAEPQPRWVLSLYLLGLPVFVAVSWEFLGPGPGLWIFAAGLASMVLGIVARFWWARRLARRGSLRPALVADVFGPWFYYAGLVVAGNLVAGRNQIRAPVVYLVILAVCAGLVLWLWPKIGRRKAPPIA